MYTVCMITVYDSIRKLLSWESQASVYSLVPLNAIYIVLGKCTYAGYDYTFIILIIKDDMFYY